MRVTKKLPRELVEKLHTILRSEKPIEGYSSDDVIHTISIRFDKRIEADIKVCNGDSPWVDAVLFEDGHEIQVLEPTDILLGEYPFSDTVTGKEYTLAKLDTMVCGRSPTISGIPPSLPSS